MLPKHLVGFPRKPFAEALKLGTSKGGFQCFLSIWWDFHRVLTGSPWRDHSSGMFQCFLSIWWDFHLFRAPSGYGKTTLAFQCFLSIWWDFHAKRGIACW